jgi:hypothetical protein
MEDDRFPSIGQLAIQAWEDRFFNILTLPSIATLAISSLVKQSYYEVYDLLFFYLTIGTFYDIESDMDH